MVGFGFKGGDPNDEFDLMGQPSGPRFGFGFQSSSSSSASSGWGAVGCADHDESMCDCSVRPSRLNQSMDEMGFMRSACAAAQAGDLVKLTRILQRSPEAVRCDGSAGSSGYTPLHYASRAGKLECVLLLLSKGSEVDALTKEGKSTSLHRAAALGHLAVVKALLAAGADPLLQDADGECALLKAAAQGHALVCSHLLQVAPQASDLTDKRGQKPHQRATGGAVAILAEQQNPVVTDSC